MKKTTLLILVSGLFLLTINTTKGQTTILEDDFNTNTIDPNKWTVNSPSDVVAQDGILKMSQNVTDQTTGVTTKALSLNNNSTITIERDIKVNPATGSGYFFPYMRIHFEGDVTKNYIDIYYMNTSYNYGAYTGPKAGIYLSGLDNAIFESYGKPAKEVKLAEVIFNEWFHEKFVFDVITGQFSYFLNNTLVKTGQIDKPCLSVPKFTLTFSPYGWFTGHTHHTDNIKVSVSNRQTVNFSGCDASLVASYPFNGNTNDESGHGNNGTPHNLMPTIDRFGHADKAYSFNGTDSYISFTRLPTAQVDNLTISLWMRPMHLRQLGMALNYGFDDGTTGDGLAIGLGDGTTGTTTMPGDKLQFLHCDVSFLPVDYTFTNIKKWVHVAIVRENAVSKIYVNGEFSVSYNNAIKTPPTSFRIGSANDLRFFKGDIDDISIYNRSLTEREVKFLYKGEPTDYYDSALNLTCANKKNALQAIINNDYFFSDRGGAKIVYDVDLWENFKKTDTKDGTAIWDMYSNCPFTYGTHQDGGTTAGTECLFYNREHSFPESWWGGSKTIPPHADLFHIYPTDKKVNGDRQHFPYGIAKYDISSPIGNGIKIGDTDDFISPSQPNRVRVFEPIDEYKGDFARAYFYMVTRYGSDIAAWENNTDETKIVLDGKRFQAFKEPYLKMLLKWDSLDPVSQKEINRNDEVFAIQGNRNPFIDHPEFVKDIWDNSCEPIVDLEKGLIAYYPLNNNPFDIGPNSLHGSPSNISYSDADNGLKAAKFNGTTSVIVLANTSTPDKTLKFSPKKFTVSAWFKDGFGTLAINGPYGYKLRIKKGTAPVKAEVEGTVFLESSTIPIGLLINKPILGNFPDFQLVTFTFDGSELALYHNGQLLGKAALTSALANKAISYIHPTEVAIGRDITNNRDYFNGLMQEVRFYDKALNEDEIKALYRISLGKRTVESIYPTFCGRGVTLPMIVKGKGFTSNLSAKLLIAGAVNPPILQKITPISDTEFRIDWFLPADTKIGKYNLEISDFPDGTSRTLQNALDIQERHTKDFKVLLIGEQHKIGIGKDALYTVSVRNEGNTPLLDLRFGFVVQLINRNSRLVVKKKSIVENFLNIGSLTPDQLESVNDFIESTEDDRTYYTMVLSKEVLYPDKNEFFQFTVKSNNLSDQFVIVAQGTPIDFDSFKPEEGCSACTKCALDIGSFAPVIGCPYSAGGIYCAVKDYDSKNKLSSWFNIGTSVIGGVLSCAGGPLGKLAEKGGGEFAKVLLEETKDASDKLGGKSILDDCKKCHPSDYKRFESVKVRKFVQEPQVSTRSIDTVHIKYGPEGFLTEKYVQNKDLMSYTIEFANQKSATNPVGIVSLKDQLDTAVFDLSSFQFSSYGWGDTTYYAEPSDGDFFFNDIDLRPSKNIIVRYLASFDRTSGAIDWRFMSLDPDTYEPINDRTQGFLLPNDSTGRGKGFVNYWVSPKNNLSHGTQMRNKSDLTLDSIAVPSTPYWINTIDAVNPVSRIKALPSTSKDTIVKLITERSDIGSGVDFYDIYVSENNGPFQRNIVYIQGDTAQFVGKNGKTYAFFSRARDYVGNWEDTTHVADAITTINLTTAVTEVKSGEVKLYPNPNSGIVYVKSPWGDAPIEINISDWAGRVLQQQKSVNQETVEVKLQHFTFGIYYVLLKNERTGEVKTAKMILD